MLYDPSKDRPVDGVGRIIWDALGVIQKRGWCQNVETNKRGHVCILRAVKVAYGETIGDSSLDTDTVNRLKLDDNLGLVFGYANGVPIPVMERLCVVLDLPLPSTQSGRYDSLLYREIANWNDAGERTEDEVLDVLRQALLIQ